MFGITYFKKNFVLENSITGLMILGNMVVDFGQEIIQTNIYNKTMLFEQKFEFPT